MNRWALESPRIDCPTNQVRFDMPEETRDEAPGMSREKANKRVALAGGDDKQSLIKDIQPSGEDLMNASTGKWMMAAGLALWLCACGAAGPQTTQPDAQKTDHSKTRVYYAGQDGLPLYPRANLSGVPLVRLPLNEKLLRTRQEGGFAYVTVDRTGQKGWVVNARLIWKKKAPSAAAPPAKSPSVKNEPHTAGAAAEEPSSDKPDASIFDSD